MLAGWLVQSFVISTNNAKRTDKTTMCPSVCMLVTRGGHWLQLSHASQDWKVSLISNKKICLAAPSSSIFWSCCTKAIRNTGKGKRRKSKTAAAATALFLYGPLSSFFVLTLDFSAPVKRRFEKEEKKRWIAEPVAALRQWLLKGENPLFSNDIWGAFYPDPFLLHFLLSSRHISYAAARERKIEKKQLLYNFDAYRSSPV